MNDQVNDHIPLLDEIDVEILIHNEVHFGGSFDSMIEYYENEGVGTNYEFQLKRIKELKKLDLDVNSILTDEALERITRSKKLYFDLRGLYENSDTPKINCLIADLILSEEEEPIQEIDALVGCKDEALGPLLDLLSSETFAGHDTPGYGRAPILAARALAKIGNPKAIPALFNTIGIADFGLDDACIEAIKSFGEEARTFLLPKLTAKPFTQDNERAAIVLSSFPSDKEIASSCLKVLLDPEAHKHGALVSYLIFPCEALATKEEQEVFRSLLDDHNIPSFFKNEIKIVLKNWK